MCSLGSLFLMQAQRVWKTTVHARSRMYNYVIHWACTVLKMFRTKSWATFPFQILTGHQCKRPVTAIGTPALWKPTLKDAERLKGEIKWSTEIYLGIKWRTSEAIIGTKDGLSYVEL